MKQVEDCGRIQEDLWRYIDRELSAASLAGISAHLKACPSCNRLYESRARDSKLYRMAFVGSPFGEGFAERFQTRMDQELLSDPLGGREPQGARSGGFSGALSGLFSGLFSGLLSGLGRGNPRKFLGQAALAAALLAIGVLVVLGLIPDSRLGGLELAGPVKMLRGGRLLPSPQSDLRAGDGFVLKEPNSELMARLEDGSLLTMRGPGEFRVDPSSRARGHFQLRIEEGSLEASVEPRVGRELRVTSPHATAVVVGTKFIFRVERGLRTVLEVSEGEVLFKGASGYQPVSAGTGAFEVRGAAQGRPQPVAGTPRETPLDLPLPLPEPFEIPPAPEKSPRPGVSPPPETDLPVTGAPAERKER